MVTARIFETKYPVYRLAQASSPSAYRRLVTKTLNLLGRVSKVRGFVEVEGKGIFYALLDKNLLAREGIGMGEGNLKETEIIDTVEVARNRLKGLESIRLLTFDEADAVVLHDKRLNGTGFLCKKPPYYHTFPRSNVPVNALLAGFRVNPRPRLRSRPFDPFAEAKNIIGNSQNHGQALPKGPKAIEKIAAQYKTLLTEEDFEYLNGVLRDSYQFFPVFIHWVNHLLQRNKKSGYIFLGGTCEIPYFIARILARRHGFYLPQILYADIPRDVRSRHSDEVIVRYLERVGVRKGRRYFLVDENCSTGGTFSHLGGLVKWMSGREVGFAVLNNQRVSNLQDAYFRGIREGILVQNNREYLGYSDLYYPRAEFVHEATLWVDLTCARDKRILLFDNQGNPRYQNYKDLKSIYLGEASEKELETAFRIFELCRYQRIDLFDGISRYQFEDRLDRSPKDYIPYAKGLYLLSVIFGAQLKLLDMMLKKWKPRRIQAAVAKLQPLFEGKSYARSPHGVLGLFSPV